MDNNVHPISELVKDRSRKQGYQKICKPCHRRRCRAYMRKVVRDNPDNMYATGVAPEVRKAIMDLEMPVWEDRFKIIDQYKLDVGKERDTESIDRALALHGLS
jgi:hypothetical protein